MKITMMINTGNGFEEFPVLNKFTMDERLDEELDGGNATTKAKTPSKIPDFAETIVSLTDGETTLKNPFFAVPTAEKRAGEYYAQTLEFVEPTRWLMGLTIDGLAITQPTEGQRDSLAFVLYRVVSQFYTRVDGEGNYFYINPADEWWQKMRYIDSPEFLWEGGTLLFEVLRDIGSVIDCIPRLSYYYDTRTGYVFNRIIFDDVNKETAEYEL